MSREKRELASDAAKCGQNLTWRNVLQKKICNICKKEGHIAKDCKSSKAKERGNKRAHIRRLEEDRSENSEEDDSQEDSESDEVENGQDSSENSEETTTL